MQTIKAAKEKSMNREKKVTREEVERLYFRRINYELTPTEVDEYFYKTQLLLAQEREATK